MYHCVLHLHSSSTEFWFGDDLFEEVPTMVAHATQTCLPKLLALLEDKELILQHRLVVSSAITRLAKEQSELRPATSAFLQRYLRHIITHAD